MTIGQQIKKLRRERDITQERLAEYLGISASAISQWECDRAMPDITQLPLLANLFEVSADVILGIDVDSKTRRIEEIYQNAYDTSVAGGRKEAIGILRDGLRQYPDSFKLMRFLASELYCFYPHNELKDNGIGAEIADYLDKILAECTDNKIRGEAVSLACLFYPKVGRTDDAVKLAESVSNDTSLELLSYIYTGTKQYETMRTNLLAKFTRSVGDFSYFANICRNDDGNRIFTDDERLEIYAKEIAMFALYFNDGDYLYHAQYPEIAHNCSATIYAKRGDRENTLYHLEQMMKFAIEFDTMDPDGVHTSLLARGIPDGGVWMEDHNRTYGELEELAEPYYDFVRDDSRFKNVEEELKKYAK